MFLEVLAFNDEILLISNSFCNFAIRKQYRFTIAKYTPYIKPKYVTREGTTVLYVRYNYNRTKRTLISTGYSIKPEHWDSKKRWIKRACPNYDEIDACLIRITSKLGEILTYAKINGISPTVDFVLLELKKNREYEFGRRDQLEDELFEVLHCWVLLDEEKIGGEIVVSLLKFMGSMVL